jgi:hypothetical protein
MQEPHRKITFDKYLRWEEHQRGKHELHNGHVYALFVGPDGGHRCCYRLIADLARPDFEANPPIHNDD